jgi:hypothetical protein
MAKRKKKSRTNPKTLTTDAKHIMAYRLRMNGIKLQEIADALGYKTCSGAQKAIEAGQRKLHFEPAINSKLLNQDRLEELLQGMWTAASKGALGSADRAIKIIQELNKMDGNYAPVQVAVADWRREAEAAGLQPSEIFEEMVSVFMKEMSHAKPTVDGTGDGRSPSRGNKKGGNSAKRKPKG